MLMEHLTDLLASLDPLRTVAPVATADDVLEAVHIRKRKRNVATRCKMVAQHRAHAEDCVEAFEDFG